MANIGFTNAVIELGLQAMFDAYPTAHLGLLTQMPDVNGDGLVELAATGYVRQPVAFEQLVPPYGIPEFPDQAIAFANADEVLFDDITWADPAPSIVGVAVFSAETGGSVVAAVEFKAGPVDPGVADSIRVQTHKVLLAGVTTAMIPE